VNEVTNLLNSAGRSMADTVKIMPIDRMNAVLVTSMQPTYMQRVRSWVERLDRGAGLADQQLFVYRVQNGRAADIARVLRQALGLAAETGPGAAAEGPAGPGAPPGPVTGLATPTQIDNLLSRPANAPGGGAPPARMPDRNAPLAGVTAAAALADGGRAPPPVRVRVTPRPGEQRLIVTGSAGLRRLRLRCARYSALAGIDRGYRRGSVVENDLRFGLQYFFKPGKFTDIFGPM
jgi:general secretion pathway protein D